MFQEDCCLQCGKPCVDGRVYCSSACEDLDAPPALSPSHSTASSALSSPYLSPSGHSSTPSPSSLSLHLHPIPPLVLPPPTKVSHRLPMWYDSDDDPIQDHDQHDAVQVHHPLPPQLSYARRPAATNTRSTIPLLASSSGSRSASTSASASGSRSATQHRRTSSRSTTATTTTTESSSMPSSPADDSYHLARPHHHHHHQHEHQAPGSPSAPSSFASSARKRANRSSLPAHFRLLASPTLRPTRPSIAVPSLSSPTGRPSPSTPKLARPHVDATPVLAGASPASAPLALSAAEVQVEVEESRGRRRIPGIRGGSGVREASTSRSRRRTRSRSRSVSRSRGRWAADGNGGEDESKRGRRRTARADGWTGTTEYGFGVGRTGLMAREAEVLRR